jgi:hypothetical protein
MSDSIFLSFSLRRKYFIHTMYEELKNNEMLCYSYYLNIAVGGTEIFVDCHLNNFFVDKIT